MSTIISPSVKDHSCAGLPADHQLYHVFQKDEDGDNCLHLCAKFGLSERATEIIDNVPKKRLLDCVNNAHQTAMHLAARNDKPFLVRHLLRAGADINILDSEGNTPLQIATSMGRDIDQLCEKKTQTTYP